MNILKKNSVKYALILCAVLIVCLALMEMTGNNQSFENKSPVFVIYQFIAPAVVWYLGIKERRTQLKNKLTFKQGLRTGFNISLVFGIISPFVFAIYYLLINPSIVENYMRPIYDMPDATTNAIILFDMFIQFISALIFGTLYAAVISLFLKTK